MKAIQCTFCRDIVPMKLYVPVSCARGLCHGRYVNLKTGEAIFSELYTKSPNHLWVIGINNLFLDSLKPTYTEWEDPEARESKFLVHKSNIVRVRPKKSTIFSSERNIIFVPCKEFITKP